MPADASASVTAEKSRHQGEHEALAPDRVRHQLGRRDGLKDRLVGIVRPQHAFHVGDERHRTIGTDQQPSCLDLARLHPGHHRHDVGVGGERQVDGKISPLAGQSQRLHVAGHANHRQARRPLPHAQSLADQRTATQVRDCGTDDDRVRGIVLAQRPSLRDRDAHQTEVLGGHEVEDDVHALGAAAGACL